MLRHKKDYIRAYIKNMSEVIERVQRRALYYLLSTISYQDALDTLGLQTLNTRKRDLCNKL